MGKPSLGGRGKGKFHQGEFVPKNRSKYIGTYPIYFRSSWEKKFMNFLDAHANVLFWGSEALKIPYVNPFTRKIANYYPDFIIISIGKDGKQTKKIVEIKPNKETILEAAKSMKDKIALALNYYKWAAARKFAHDNDMEFSVITEKQLFGV